MKRSQGGSTAPSYTRNLIKGLLFILREKETFNLQKKEEKGPSLMFVKVTEDEAVFSSRFSGLSES